MKHYKNESSQMKEFDQAINYAKKRSEKKRAIAEKKARQVKVDMAGDFDKMCKAIVS